MEKLTSKMLSRNLAIEFKTVCAMVKLYCHKHHQQQQSDKSDKGSKQGDSVCHECADLIEYALARLDRCPYGEFKPTCNTCPIHCYKKSYKERMHQVMRYAGPRMLLHHPWLAIRHLWHERKKVEKKPPAHVSNRYLRKQGKG